jgi:short-subunit dehydrogenase
MRAVLITGVSSGIGESIADELLSADEFIVIGSVRNIDDAKILKDKYKNFYEVIFDVTNKDAILKGKIEVERILKENNSYLSCLINNAGIAIGGPVRYLDVDFFRHQFEVNFFGLIEVTKIFLDLLIDSNKYKMKNKIINIGSISGKRSYPFVAPYTSSKHALEGFSDSLRRELMIHELDVILLEPGPIKTPIWDKVPDIEKNPFLNTEYGESLRKFNKGYLKTVEADGFPPKIIGEKVLNIMQTNRPKTRYVITPKIIKNYFIPGFLPDRWVDRMIGKMLGLIKKL